MAEGMIDTLTSRLAKLEPLPGSPLDLPRRAPHLLARFYKEQQKAPKGLKDGAEAGKGKTSTRDRTTINAYLQERVTGLVPQPPQRFKAGGIDRKSDMKGKRG